MPTIGQLCQQRGISRRSFLKFCATTASLLSLPPSLLPRWVEAVENAHRQPVIWLSFQECTGCTESFTRASTDNLETLIFDHISLDYHHTLQAAAGAAAERAREETLQVGDYLLVVEGAIPLANPGYSTIAGISNLDLLKQMATGAKALIAIGNCAAFGGIPHALPNPTGAVSVAEIITDKPVINVPGCPPIPAVFTSTLIHLLAFGEPPELDDSNRPLAFFGQSIHSQCYRRTFFDQGLFAETFDDEGAKQGWCLYKLGCKGPMTHNACASLKWDDGLSFPIQSGHGCLGCAELDFWDTRRFYQSLFSSESTRTLPVLGVGIAIDKQGQSATTQAQFAGGIAIKTFAFQKQLTTRLAEPVDLSAEITVDPEHVGQSADIVVFAAYRALLAPIDSPALYFMLDSESTILPWNEAIAELATFQTVTLAATQSVPLYQGAFIATGRLQVYLGYRLANGMIVQNAQSIDVVITE